MIEFIVENSLAILVIAVLLVIFVLAILASKRHLKLRNPARVDRRRTVRGGNNRRMGDSH